MEFSDFVAETNESSGQPAPRRTIAINAVSATTGGGLSVARNLAEYLALVRPEWEIEFFISQPAAQPEHVPQNLKIKLDTGNSNIWHRFRWEQAQFPQIEAESKIDATILLGGFTPFRSRVPQIAVWQNAHVWSGRTPDQSAKMRGYILAQRILMRLSVRRARRNVFLSENSINECAKAFPITRERCRVIPIGPESKFSRIRSIPSVGERQNFLLAVGDQYPHKRFELIIEALHRVRTTHPSLELRIAGRPIDASYHQSLKNLVKRLRLEEHVQFLGGLTTDQLIEQYECARIYIAASSLETFGLTPIEAMSSGLPVIASRDSATPEVCGSAANYFDSTSESLGEAISGLLASDDEWLRLQESGASHARMFAWDRIAEQYARLVEETLTDPGR